MRKFLHFTAADGWFGDPMPLWHDGIYHIYYTKRFPAPSDDERDMIGWGHISSPDLLHWTEHPDPFVHGTSDTPFNTVLSTVRMGFPFSAGSWHRLSPRIWSTGNTASPFPSPASPRPWNVPICSATGNAGFSFTIGTRHGSATAHRSTAPMAERMYSRRITLTSWRRGRCMTAPIDTSSAGSPGGPAIVESGSGAAICSIRAS